MSDLVIFYLRFLTLSRICVYLFFRLLLSWLRVWHSNSKLFFTSQVPYGNNTLNQYKWFPQSQQSVWQGTVTIIMYALSLGGLFSIKKSESRWCLIFFCINLLYFCLEFFEYYIYSSNIFYLQLKQCNNFNTLQKNPGQFP